MLNTGTEQIYKTGRVFLASLEGSIFILVTSTFLEIFLLVFLLLKKLHQTPTTRQALTCHVTFPLFRHLGSVIDSKFSIFDYMQCSSP